MTLTPASMLAEADLAELLGESVRFAAMSRGERAMLVEAHGKALT